MSTHRNRVQMTVSGTPGTGTITLGSASSGYQSFATAYAANATVDILIVDGTAWEVARNCTYTNSGTTVTRGTLEASSTGSAISLTSAAVVSVIPTAEVGNWINNAISGYIVGLDITYSSTTAVAVSSGTISLNGVQRSYTGATYTSASTMKDLANNTVTIGASKCYFLFAYNNAGTVEIRFEERDGTGDGADPTFDSTLNYWRAASTGAEARRIGKFWTNASSQVINFTSKTVDRKRTFFTHDRSSLAYINAGAATTYTSFALTPYVTADDQQMQLEVFGERVTSTGPVWTALSIDGTNSFFEFYFNSVAVGNYSLGIPASLPAFTTLYYKTQTNSRSYVRLLQTECLV